MKKAVSAITILLLFLCSTVSEGAYLLRLKNGRHLTTPMYWFEDQMIFFYCPGGTAGIEKRYIDKIEPYETYAGSAPREAAPKQDVPSLSSQKERSPGSGKTPEAAEGKETVSLESYKAKKDQMQAELDGLVERQRDAVRIGDDAAKKKIGEEIIAVSKGIYTLTDEATEKNKGNLPDGWWGR